MDMTGTVRKLEDLIVFQRGRRLAALVSETCGAGRLATDQVVRNQMRRAALSVVSNVGEGFERGGNREFLHFLSIAKGSAGELKAQTYIAADAALISEDQCAALVQTSNSFCAAAAGLIRFLQSTEMRGAKWNSEGDGRQRLREVSARYEVPAVPDDHTPLDIPAEHFTE